MKKRKGYRAHLRGIGQPMAPNNRPPAKPSFLKFRDGDQRKGPAPAVIAKEDRT